MNTELGQWIVMQDALHSAYGSIVRVRAELNELRHDVHDGDDDSTEYIDRIADAEGRLLRAIDDLRVVRTHLDSTGIDRIEYAD